MRLTPECAECAVLPLAVSLLLLLVVCSQEKIEAIAVGTYGAAGVSYSPEAEEAIQVRAREARRASACACGR